MKRKTLTQIFVDDGFPEASDYDTNFISYDPSIQGSCENALLEAKNRSTTLPKNPYRSFRTNLTKKVIPANRLYPL